MANVIFIAPPAAGKGVQSELLQTNYKMLHVSTGDLLRQEVATETELGGQIKLLMEQGLLVSDEIVISLLTKKLKQSDLSQGYILDGFPRTIEQAQRLDQLTKEIKAEIDYVFFLSVDKDIALKRALGRVTCSNCGTIYNEYFDTFATPGVCNKCNFTLIKRKDDNEETFSRRFDEYLTKSKPLIDYYIDKGIFHEIDSSKDIMNAFNQIKNIIDKDITHD